MRQSLVIVILIALLAACDQQQDEPLPTVVPTIQIEDPTPTREVAETVEPSPTPSRVERPTLPPTWTPTPSPTIATQEVTATPLPTIASPPQECGGFGPDTSVTIEEFQLGESPTIGWRAVETAGSYWVVILDPAGNVIHERFLEELSYVIPWEVFPAPLRYGWEVRPLDANGIQMCDARGGRLIAR